MARISGLRGDHSFCCVHARCFVGGADVSLSAGRTNLHYAMVFARRVSLVPMAISGRATDAFRCACAGGLAVGRPLVVREQSALSLVGPHRSTHGGLHFSYTGLMP